MGLRPGEGTGDMSDTADRDTIAELFDLPELQLQEDDYKRLVANARKSLETAVTGTLADLNAHRGRRHGPPGLWLLSVAAAAAAIIAVASALMSPPSTTQETTEVGLGPQQTTTERSANPDRGTTGPVTSSASPTSVPVLPATTTSVSSPSSLVDAPPSSDVPPPTSEAESPQTPSDVTPTPTTRPPSMTTRPPSMTTQPPTTTRDPLSQLPGGLGGGLSPITTADGLASEPAGLGGLFPTTTTAGTAGCPTTYAPTSLTGLSVQEMLTRLRCVNTPWAPAVEAASDACDPLLVEYVHSGLMTVTIDSAQRGNVDQLPAGNSWSVAQATADHLVLTSRC